MANKNKKTVTHIKSNEVQGRAAAPTKSKSATAAGFAAAYKSTVKGGVENIPHIPGYSQSDDVNSDCWGEGFDKPGQV